MVDAKRVKEFKIKASFVEKYYFDTTQIENSPARTPITYPTPYVGQLITPGPATPTPFHDRVGFTPKSPRNYTPEPSGHSPPYGPRANTPFMPNTYEPSPVQSLNTGSLSPQYPLP